MVDYIYYIRAQWSFNKYEFSEKKKKKKKKKKKHFLRKCELCILWNCFIAEICKLCVLKLMKMVEENQCDDVGLLLGALS